MEICLKILHYGLQLTSVECANNLTYWFLVLFSLPLIGKCYLLH